MSAQHHSSEKHPLSSGMDHALDGDLQGPVKQLRRPGDSGPAMQSAANNSAQVKQLKASEAAANTAVVQRKQANETGLPDGLKTGVESMSGLSLDHVKVVYNSPKPAEVNALAYAEGSVIHVAPGQEQHLPEEAWHLVQQMQGKVKATTQVDGKAINDDPHLEKQAQDMGAKAANNPQPIKESQPLTPAPSTDGVVQRRIEPYQTTAPKEDKEYYKNSVKKIVTRVDSLVENARDSALNWQDYEESDRPRMKLWAATASMFFENPDVVPDFLHARFGYAVEDIVSTELPKEEEGLKINLQVAAGHTRPDIVLLDDNIQVAWLDITAEESVGHIKNKSGSGWSNRPFVCEVLYDSLELEEVLSASSNPLTSALGQYSAQKGQIKHDNEVSEKEKLTKQLVDFADHNGYKSGLSNKAMKKKATKDYMDSVGMDLDPSQANKEAKGTLAYLEINPLRFGFKHGKSTILRAKEFIEGKAQKKTTQEIAQLQMGLFTDLLEDIRNEEQCDLQKNFVNAAINQLKKKVVLDNHVKIGIAVREALRLRAKAEELSEEKNRSLDNHEEAQELIQEIHQEIYHYMPTTLDLDTLRYWHTNLLGLTQKLEAIEEDEWEESSSSQDKIVQDEEEGSTELSGSENDTVQDDEEFL